MTPKQEKICHAIIHGHAAAAAGGNILPGVGIAADIITMTTMTMALCAVFGGSIIENEAKSMAIAALKSTLLKQPLKLLAKFIPFAGAFVSVAMLESTGWILARELDSKFSDAQSALPAERRS
jgi:uncharacterized protein (DUF697 family)